MNCFLSGPFPFQGSITPICQFSELCCHPLEAQSSPRWSPTLVFPIWPNIVNNRFPQILCFHTTLVYYCFKQVTTISGLKTAQIYYHTVLKVRGLIWCHWVKIRVSTGLHSFLDILRENPFSFFFQFLEASFMAYGFLPSSKPAAAGRAFLLYVSLTLLLSSHFTVPLIFLLLLSLLSL